MRTEPLWWMLFAAGGTLAALLTPLLLLLTGFAAPFGWIREPFAYGRMLALAAHPLSRLVLFALISLSFFHWAHRFRYTLSEGLALTSARRPLATLCYGAAAVGTVAAALALVRL